MVFNLPKTKKHSTVYRTGRIFFFRNSPGIDLNHQFQAIFSLPEVNKLAEEARSCSLDILFVSTSTGMHMLVIQL